MIPVIPIAAALLAVLDDNDSPPDFDELFRRAVAFENPDIFWGKIEGNQIQQVLDEVLAPLLIQSYVQSQSSAESKREFDAICRVVSGDGILAQPVIEGIFFAITQRLLTAHSIFDLKEEISALNDEIETAAEIYHGRAVMIDPDGLFDFWPSSSVFAQPRRNILVPTWGQIVGVGAPGSNSSLSFLSEIPTSKGTVLPWDPRKIISWDENVVLVSDARDRGSIERNGVFLNRHELGL